MGKIRQFIKNIPIVSTIAIWVYKLLTLPSSVRKIRDDLGIVVSETEFLKAAIAAVKEGSARDARTLRSDIERQSQVFQQNTALLRDDILKRCRISVPVGDRDNKLQLDLLTVIDDYILCIPAEDLRLTRLAAFFGNVEHPGLRKTMKDFLQPDSIFVDVGAHVGLYTVLATTRIIGKGRIFSFEPSDRAFDLLTKNIYIYDTLEKVTARRVAVSDKSGEKLKLAVYNCQGHNTLFPYNDRSDYIEVESVCLDDALANVPKIDVVKIDVEGAEHLVLRGMKNVIRRNPQIAIFMEFSPLHIKRAGLDVDAYIKEIHSYGFSISDVEGTTGEIHAITDHDLAGIEGTNVMLKIPSP